MCTSTPAQWGVSDSLFQGLEQYRDGRNYYEFTKLEVLNRYIKLYSFIYNSHEWLKIKPIRSQGGFFMIVDVRDIVIPEEYKIKDKRRDCQFCLYMADLIHIIFLPCSELSNNVESCDDNYVRVALCKSDNAIDDLINRFKKLNFK